MKWNVWIEGRKKASCWSFTSRKNRKWLQFMKMLKSGLKIWGCTCLLGGVWLSSAMKFSSLPHPCWIQDSVHFQWYQPCKSDNIDHSSILRANKLNTQRKAWCHVILWISNNISILLLYWYLNSTDYLSQSYCMLCWYSSYTLFYI